MRELSIAPAKSVQTPRCMGVRSHKVTSLGTVIEPMFLPTLSLLCQSLSQVSLSIPPRSRKTSTHRAAELQFGGDSYWLRVRYRYRWRGSVQAHVILSSSGCEHWGVVVSCLIDTGSTITESFLPAFRALRPRAAKILSLAAAPSSQRPGHPLHWLLRAGCGALLKAIASLWDSGGQGPPWWCMFTGPRRSRDECNLQVLWGTLWAAWLNSV